MTAAELNTDERRKYALRLALLSEPTGLGREADTAARHSFYVPLWPVTSSKGTSRWEPCQLDRATLTKIVHPLIGHVLVAEFMTPGFLFGAVATAAVEASQAAPIGWLGPRAASRANGIREHLRELVAQMASGDTVGLREKPNAVAQTLVERALEIIEESAMPEPERVVPDSGGGFGLLYFAGAPLRGGARPRYVSINASNTGELSAVAHDRASGATSSWDLDLDDPSSVRAVFDLLYQFLNP